ncbi:MAG: hypothetical protein HY784_04275, partial [Chloroflexi bacterium]|nr:hypothetical protein [Chloroflexota bacterium]
MSTTLKSRLRLVVAVLALGAGLALFQLVRIPFGGPYFVSLVKAVVQERHMVTTTRGQIYDAGGDLLATNNTEYEVGLD